MKLEGKKGKRAAGPGLGKKVKDAASWNFVLKRGPALKGGSRDKKSPNPRSLDETLLGKKRQHSQNGFYRTCSNRRAKWRA